VTIPNPGFEADAFTVWPGYAGINGGIEKRLQTSASLRCATDDSETRSGINQSLTGGEGFCHNGLHSPEPL